jgi:uncharacterized protein (DUF4415 family)
MTASKRSTAPAWSDPDDATDLSTREWKRKLDAVPARRGRPRSETPKVSTTIRLDADVLNAFKSGGRGWQSRINEALRDAIKRAS